MVVRVEDVDFRLHKCVLAAASSKLQAMLYSMRQECGNVLSLEDVTLNGFRVLMDFMYSGMLKVESVYMQDVLAAAQYLDIREVEKTCLEIMSHMGTQSIGDPQQHLRAMVFASSGGLDIEQSLPQPTVLVQPTTSISQPVTPVPHTSQTMSSSPPTLPCSPPEPVHPDPPVTGGHASSPAENTPPTNTSLPITQLQPSQTFTAPIAGMAVDTNYIEDYLKLIESLQGEPGSQAGPHSKVIQISNHLDRSDIASHPNSDMGSQSRVENSCTIPLATNAAHSYTQSSSISSTHKLLGVQKGMNSCRNVSDSSLPSSASARSVAPGNLYSAEDVRRTILSVLSQEKFGEGEEEENIKNNCQVYDRENVPLTALLNMDPVDQEGEHEGDGHEHIDEQGSLINSSLSDNSDGEQNELEDQTESSDNRESRPSIILSQMAELEPAALKFKIHQTKPDPEGHIVLSKQKRKIKTPVRVDRKAVADVTCSDTEGRINDIKVVTLKKKAKRNKTFIDIHSKSKKSNKVALLPEDGIKTKPLKKRLKLKIKRRNVCDKCGREFYKQESLDKHKELHDLNQMHSCHVCCQKFARPCELTRHLRTHSAEVFKCPLCDVEYIEPTAYRQHMVSVHQESKAFFCQYVGCKFRSTKLSNVEKHSVIHSDVKTFQCHQCGRKFAQANGLRSHVRSCLEQRSYLCDICGAKFNHLQSMKNHRRLHTGEKPHQCHDCGAKFTDHRNYKRHRRIHENIFPYPCTICNKKFRHSNSLKAHVQTHIKQINPDSFNMKIKAAFEADGINIVN